MMPKAKGLSISTKEREIFMKGYSKIIGIDEVGRGCMAGPMVVGIFVLYDNSDEIAGVRDSKQISPKNRRELSSKLTKSANQIYEISPMKIDEKGLSRCFKDCINKIYTDYNSKNTFFLLDGNFKFNKIDNIECIVKGDEKIYSIAAASIIAKVYRDDLMYNFSKDYPEYGFDTHVGYCTKKHIEHVKKHGPCKIHRRSYAPIKKFLEDTTN